MTAALQGFRRQGLATASLSVTVGNDHAYRLYERLGFRLRKQFAAHAWVRPPARIELPPAPRA
jgi:ribosomal protein S18 acetylase RimI-like enzyme